MVALAPLQRQRRRLVDRRQSDELWVERLERHVARDGAVTKRLVEQLARCPVQLDGLLQLDRRRVEVELAVDGHAQTERDGGGGGEPGARLGGHGEDRLRLWPEFEPRVLRGPRGGEEVLVAAVLLHQLASLGAAPCQLAARLAGRALAPLGAAGGAGPAHARHPRRRARVALLEQAERAAALLAVEGVCAELVLGRQVRHGECLHLAEAVLAREAGRLLSLQVEVRLGPLDVVL
mmetsp:Transcript_50694/g.164286  ORF Transcript_50694/g.164286 Transcript_50694/m.164286 type:complete len:235 (-) Transcript_50694:1000-1704(-)